MKRIGVYVYSLTTINVSGEAKAIRYVPGGEPRIEVGVSGEIQLSQGIYRLDPLNPNTTLQVTGGAGADIVTVLNEKDPWPDPKAQVQTNRFEGSFPNVSLQELQGFFPVVERGVEKLSDAHVS